MIITEQINHKKKKNISKMLSANLGVNYFTISKLFSKIEGQTIEQYFIHQRIEKVKELLVKGDLSLTVISYQLNYSSSQHLSRQFKKHTGLTPTQFKDIGQRKLPLVT